MERQPGDLLPRWTSRTWAWISVAMLVPASAGQPGWDRGLWLPFLVALGLISVLAVPAATHHRLLGVGVFLGAVPAVVLGWFLLVGVEPWAVLPELALVQAWRVHPDHRRRMFFSRRRQRAALTSAAR